MARGPRRPRPRAGGRGARAAGFTLIELMVALAILSFVIAGMYLSLGASATHARRLSDGLARHRAVRLALQRMGADLEDATWAPGLAPDFFSGESRGGGEARRDTLAFIAAPYPWLGGRGGDLVRIVYSLKTAGAKGGASLVRRVVPIQGAGSGGEGASAVVLEGVRELAIQYLDAAGGVHDSWPPGGGDAGLPAAVRVSLALEGGGGERFGTLFAIPMGLRSPVAGGGYGEAGTTGQSVPGTTGSPGGGANVPGS